MKTLESVKKISNQRLYQLTEIEPGTTVIVNCADERKWRQAASRFNQLNLGVVNVRKLNNPDQLFLTRLR